MILGLGTKPTHRERESSRASRRPSARELRREQLYATQPRGALPRYAEGTCYACSSACALAAGSQSARKRTFYSASYLKQPRAPALTRWSRRPLSDSAALHPRVTSPRRRRARELSRMSKPRLNDLYVSRCVGVAAQGLWRSSGAAQSACACNLLEDYATLVRTLWSASHWRAGVQIPDHILNNVHLQTAMKVLPANYNFEVTYCLARCDV